MITWQEELKSLYQNSTDLLHALELDRENIFTVNTAHFPIRVPKSFVLRMKKKDPLDPLLLQVLPTLHELNSEPAQLSLSADPLQEKNFIRSKGVLQKFQGRVLIVSTGYCPIHCRYCFRRHFEYNDLQISLKDWNATLDDLRSDPSITEVIFSGGDPLTLPDHKLESLFNDLGTIPHIRTVRIHTRFPIVIPSRLTPRLKKILKEGPSKKIRIVVVLHINHAQELDDNLSTTLRDWNNEGILFFNQAVLLKRINDSLESQKALWMRCFESGVLAYYLHQFDAVENAGHFFVPIVTGQAIMKGLRESLPGYMVPLYVQEIPFAGSKVPLESYIEKFLS